MEHILWDITRGDDPIVATAIHDGHGLRPEVAEWMALSADERRREEDPYTGGWVHVAPTQIVVKRSRFEVDLNRPRDRAVYRTPADAWGLTVYRSDPPQDLVDRSLAEYDAFYAEVERILSDVVARHGVGVVLDLHTYNHRRGGPDAEAADPKANPEVNLGTGTLDRQRFGHLAERFINDLRAFDFDGRSLDVRENVTFQGGHFSRWIHGRFPGQVGVLAIEFKKFFMDEWTGIVDKKVHETISRALAATVVGLRQELGQHDG